MVWFSRSPREKLSPSERRLELASMVSGEVLAGSEGLATGVGVHVGSGE